MVLEAAFDDSPTSDFDPYDSSNSSYNPQVNDAVRIDLSKAAAPFPILGPILGFTQRKLLQKITSIIARAPQVLQRPLTQDEVDAVVEGVSRGSQTHSWVYANGLIFGLVRSYSTEAEGKYPLWRLNGQRRITPQLLGLPQGAIGQAAARALRTSIYCAAFMLPAYLIGGLMGQTVVAASQLKDPRMQQFVKDMQKPDVQRNLQGMKERTMSGLPEPTVQMQQNSRLQDIDDMSPRAPTGSKQSQMYRDPAKQNQQEFEQTPQQAQYGTSNASDTSWKSDKTSSFDRSEYATTSQSGSQGQPQSAWDRIRNQAGSTESAWDRVRRQGGAGQEAGTQTQWQPQRNISDNDYSFNEQDEDRQLARSEAQKEFNDRIERERQGKNFDDSQAGRGVW